MNFLFLETLGYESALRLSGHHYARLLAGRGHRVASLSAPVTPLHHLARSGRESIARRFANHRAGWVEAPGGVLHYVPEAWLPVRRAPVLGTVAAARLAVASYARQVDYRLREIKLEPDAVIIQNMMFYPLLRRFPGAVVLYRMVDLLDGFADMPPSMLEFERRLLREADLVSITSEQFVSKLRGMEEKVILANNGVDVAHFARPLPRPAAYESIARPVVVYVGALREWFDWNLLMATARALPDSQFVVISPDAPRAESLALPNFTYIPGVPYEQVPAYVQHAAAAFIPFKRTPLIDGVSPIKMFEALAAGTPVVATAWRELEATHAPAALISSPAEATQALREAFAAPRRDYGDFLARYSWESNLDKMLERIEEKRQAKASS